MMQVELKRKWFIEIARLFYLVPYIYGGGDHYGIDCSGLIVYGLRKIGYIRKDEDYGTADLYKLFMERKALFSAGPMPGAIEFWFDNNRAFHCAICIDEFMTIQAARGDETIKTADAAFKKDAFVDYVRAGYYNGEKKYLNIFV